MPTIISNHPFIWAGILFVFVSFPQWAQSVWGLFSHQPLIPLITAKLQFMKIQNFSIYWITTSIGLVLLLLIYLNTRVSPPNPHDSEQQSPDPKTFAEHEPGQFWEMRTGQLYQPRDARESEYENILDHDFNAEDLDDEGCYAANAGDYWFAVQLFQRGDKLFPERKKTEGYPVYAACLLLTGNIAAGKSKFEDLKRDMQDAIHHNQPSPSNPWPPFLGDPQKLHLVVEGIAVFENKGTPEVQAIISSNLDDVITLKNSARQ